MFIGSGFILPGVSGGALAAIFGLYERMIAFLANVTKDFKKNVLFFLPVGIGALAGIVVLSFGVSYLLGNFETIILWFFIGCIVGTIPALWKEAGKEEKEIELNLDSKVLDLRGEITLLELAELTKRAVLVVSNDSAPIHITSAFPDTRIIGIFGPTVKDFGFFPWSQNSKVFEIDNLYCRPCAIHGGNSCPEKHFRCMREITPDLIENEIYNYVASIDNKKVKANE